jgi:hypothetical protein
MSDSLLVEALEQSRIALGSVAEIESRSLHARLRLLEGVTATLELDPASMEDVVKVAKLVLDFRDEVFDSCRKSLALREELEAMMD